MIQSYLVALLVAVFGCIGSYFYGHSVGVDAESAKQLREERIAEVASRAANKAAAEEIAKIEVKQVTIRQRVEKEIYEKPIYRECRHSDDVLLNINAALTNGAEPASYRKLPAVDPAR